MKHSYILAGTTTGKLMQMVLRNGISLNPKLLLRFLFLVQNGFWASVFKRREKGKFGKAISQTNLASDPIIIIGHWRTGSTLLHQLMSLDPNLAAPTVFQVSLPDSMLFSEKYYRPVMSKMMSPTRPMDNVKLGFDEPQEDEYALLKMTADSPLTHIIFPEKSGYFIRNYQRFQPRNESAWKEAMILFCRKLTLASGKRIVLKNPFHSMRIDLLMEIFPNAKFIHIHRHPYKVVPSTIHMWNTVARQNRLKGTWKEPSVEEVSKGLNHMINEIRNSFETIPVRNRTEIYFESFETNPVESLKKIYADLDLVFKEEFEGKIRNYLSGLSNYKKNLFTLNEDDKNKIREICSGQFDHYQYPH